jgi:hypothetical protein
MSNNERIWKNVKPIKRGTPSRSEITIDCKPGILSIQDIKYIECNYDWSYVQEKIVRGYL